jgi:acyl-CoA thioester hydrolase
VFKTWRRVEWRDLDPAGHVNNAVYSAYLEDCGMQTVAAHGWPAGRMLDEGFAILARRYQLEYRQPAALDDELQVATWASDMKHATALRHFVISRVSDGALILRARTYWAWVDPQSGRPVRIPEAFRVDLGPNIASTPGRDRASSGGSTP